MANDWFQFKQFRVAQDQCAMKVSTDACIQGAWAAQMLADSEPECILDIGTGTGLLSLMLAQQTTNAHIEAIEINGAAYAQAKANFTASPWSDRLQATHCALSRYIPGQPNVDSHQPDFIACNPPFFHNQLPAQQKERNDARHSVSLSKEELATSANRLLAETGKFCVMYPEREWQDWQQKATANGLFATDLLLVKPKPGVMHNRIIGIFSRQQKGPAKEQTLVIYEKPGVYTEAFRALLQPYYLAL